VLFFFLEIVDNDFEGKIPDEEYSTYNYIDHVVRQTVGTDKTMLLTSFITHDFFNRFLLENGTFSNLIPRLIDVNCFKMFEKSTDSICLLFSRWQVL